MLILVGVLLLLLALEFPVAFAMTAPPPSTSSPREHTLVIMAQRVTVGWTRSCCWPSPFSFWPRLITGGITQRLIDLAQARLGYPRGSPCGRRDQHDHGRIRDRCGGRDGTGTSSFPPWSAPATKDILCRAGGAASTIGGDPTSIPFVIYGNHRVSLGACFSAGGPGVLMGVFLKAAVYWVQAPGYRAEAGRAVGCRYEHLRAIPVIVPLHHPGGIFSGVVTPTEAQWWRSSMPCFCDAVLPELTLATGSGAHLRRGNTAKISLSSQCRPLRLAPRPRRGPAGCRSVSERVARALGHSPHGERLLLILGCLMETTRFS